MRRAMVSMRWRSASLATVPVSQTTSWDVRTPTPVIDPMPSSVARRVLIAVVVEASSTYWAIGFTVIMPQPATASPAAASTPKDFSILFMAPPRRTGSSDGKPRAQAAGTPNVAPRRGRAPAPCVNATHMWVIGCVVRSAAA